jgi:hypothetical protein
MKATNIISSFRGAPLREPGIHNPCREFGFRACAKRAHPGMTDIVTHLKHEVLKP